MRLAYNNVPLDQEGRYMDIVWERCVRRCWQLRASTDCANGSLTSSVSSNCPPHKHNSPVMWALKRTVAIASIISFNPFEKCFFFNSVKACSQVDVISLFPFKDLWFSPSGARFIQSSLAVFAALKLTWFLFSYFLISIWAGPDLFNQVVQYLRSLHLPISAPIVSAPPPTQVEPLL